MLTRSFYLVRSMFAWRQPGCSNLIWSDRVGWTEDYAVKMIEYGRQLLRQRPQRG